MDHSKKESEKAAGREASDVERLVMCHKCGDITNGQFQAMGYPLCRICAGWFGSSMVNFRNSLIDISST